MRSYLGERDTFGRPIVWVIDKPEEPGVADLAAFAADLRAHLVDGRPVDVADLMARKHDLLERIEAAKHRSQEPLEHSQVHSPDGFEWGYAGNGPADLAHAILTNYLGTQPPDLIRFEFRDQIVAGLPRDRFLLRADQIDVWIQANQRLFREIGAAEENGSAWSVAEPATAGGLGEANLNGNPGTAGRLGEAGLTVDPATASTLVAACEGAWADIRSHHPELPEAVMVLGSGIERGRLVKLGHWWGGQWVADGQARGEVLLAGEALHLQPSQVFEILLHEAAHGINAARRIKDTSRGGRYHNKQFAATAREVLLRVRPMPPYGLASTSLTPGALDRYGPTITRLGEAMRIARQIHAGVSVGEGIEGSLEGGKQDGRDTANGQPKTGQNAASCGCGRKMRMAPSTLAAGPVVCGLCGSEFTNGPERQTPIKEGTTDRVAQAGTNGPDSERHGADGGPYQNPRLEHPADQQGPADSAMPNPDDPLRGADGAARRTVSLDDFADPHGSAGAGREDPERPINLADEGLRQTIPPDDPADQQGPGGAGRPGQEVISGYPNQGPQRRSDAEDRSAGVIDRSFLTRRQAAVASDPDPSAGDAKGRVDPHADSVVGGTNASTGGQGVLLDRQRARLESALAATSAPVEPTSQQKTERRNRLERILTDSLKGGEASVIVDAAGASARVAADPATRDRGDLDALRRWYERYNTQDEQPIPAATAADVARRERLARVILKADGSLAGPAVTTDNGTELLAGDRVVATADHGDLPAGTPGTIERVDPDSKTVEVDFATWGRLETTLTEGLARDLRHDYAEIKTPELEQAGIEL